MSVTPNCGEDLHIRAKQGDKESEIHQLANTQLIKTHGNMLSGPISRQGTQMKYFHTCHCMFLSDEFQPGKNILEMCAYKYFNENLYTKTAIKHIIQFTLAHPKVVQNVPFGPFTLLDYRTLFFFVHTTTQQGVPLLPHNDSRTKQLGSMAHLTVHCSSCTILLESKSTHCVANKSKILLVQNVFILYPIMGQPVPAHLILSCHSRPNSA